MRQDYLPKMQSYLDEVSPALEDGVQLTLLRSDGVVLHSTESNKNIKTTTGVLSAGLWQAAQSLIGLLGEQSDQQYKLIFSTSNSGLLMRSVDLINESFYLVLLYEDQVNPGPLQFELRKVASRLIEIAESEVSQLGKRAKELSSSHQTTQNDDFLFNNITDAEMDALFPN